MNSPTHSLIALAVLSKKDDTKRNWWVFAGSLIPDAFIYVCWVWLTFAKGESQARIWDDIYFDAPMQLTASLFNSIPIYFGLAAIGFWQRTKIWGKLLLVFALAALIHIAFDFPVHGHDAYAHFWPFTDWKFHSPFSYWEVDHHARWVSLIEAVIGLTAIYILWQRFPRVWVRGLLGGLVMLYLIGQVMMQLAPSAIAG